MSSLIDLSHVVTDGMVTYPGLPAPVIRDHLSREASIGRYAPGTEFQIGRIEMVANTGTYVDAPFHRYAGGTDLAGLDLAALADLPGLVVRAGGSSPAIDHDVFTALDPRGRAVLIHTGWDRHWGTDAYGAGGHPFLTRAAAEHLARAGARLVGIDSLNIDDTGDLSRPAHTELLGAEIPIAEHLRGLSSVPGEGARFFAVPVKVRGFGTFPVRAFAIAD